MTTIGFINGTVLVGDTAPADAGFVMSDDGLIAAIGTAGADAIDLDGGWLVPGFIDVQVNGGGGVLFNDMPTVDGIAAIGAAHAAYGTTGFLPTLISDEMPAIAAALAAVDAAIAAGVPGVVGVHIEGPFINAARKGIHDPTMFRRLDAAAIALLTRPNRGRVMVTLAPELCAPADIAALVAGGVIVSAGHSDADHATVRRALDAGMTGFTHLFNAMSPLHHRAPGMVGAALDDPDSWCGLIVDGIHVDPVALRIALRAKRHDRFMLVTDAMPGVGAAKKGFMLNGQPIRVERGMCIGAGGTLAGSDLDMAGAVRNVVAMTGLTVADAVQMAAASPAAFLGMDAQRGVLSPGRRADFVWLDADLTVRGTWIGGRRVFTRN